MNFSNPTKIRKIEYEEKVFQIFFLKTKYSTRIMNRGREIAISILAFLMGFLFLPSLSALSLRILVFTSSSQFPKVSCTSPCPLASSLFSSSTLYSVIAKQEKPGVFDLK